jgi:hypothetical protein
LDQNEFVQKQGTSKNTIIIIIPYDPYLIIGHFPHFHTELHGNGMSMLSSADSLDLLMLLLDFLCISLWVGIQPRLAILQSLNGNLDEHLPATQRKHPEETSSN